MLDRSGMQPNKVEDLHNTDQEIMLLMELTLSPPTFYLPLF